MKMKAINSSKHQYAKVSTREVDDEDEEFLGYKKQMKMQNKNLDILGDSVSRLGALSLGISKEIDTQNRLLDSLDLEVDAAKESTDSLTLKVKEYLVKSSGGTKNCTIIVVLTIILLILVMLVIYT